MIGSFLGWPTSEMAFLEAAGSTFRMSESVGRSRWAAPASALKGGRAAIGEHHLATERGRGILRRSTAGENERYSEMHFFCGGSLTRKR